MPPSSRHPSATPTVVALESVIATDGDPIFRGTRSIDEVCAEVRSRVEGQRLTIPLLVRTVHAVTIDWSKQGWLTDPLVEVLGQIMAAVKQDASQERDVNDLLSNSTRRRTNL